MPLSAAVLPAAVQSTACRACQACAAAVAAEAEHCPPPQSSGLVERSLWLRRSSGLESVVGSPVVSLNAMRMYRAMAFPALSSASACITWGRAERGGGKTEADRPVQQASCREAEQLES